MLKKSFLLMTLVFSFAFSAELSLTVLSYIGKIEYSRSEFGPWKTLEVDESIPSQGYLRTPTTDDSADLLRSDEVVIRIPGKTIVRVESLLETPKPKKGLAGLFRKKKAVIEIKNDMAVAAVRGSVQGGNTPQTTQSTPSPRNTEIGIGFITAPQENGFLLSLSHTNQNMAFALALPFIWTNSTYDTSLWQTLDGWLSIIQLVRFGSQNEMVFLQYGENSIRFGEGLILDASFKHWHPFVYNENILEAQLNFGDIAIRSILDRIADSDRLGVEVAIRPLWGTEWENVVIRTSLVNEFDPRTAFYPQAFTTTNASSSFTTTYSISFFLPLKETLLWNMALFGEIAGINQHSGFMGGAQLGLSNIISIRGALAWNETGFLPWYFNTSYRYFRPMYTAMLDCATNQMLSWTLSGSLGKTSLLSLSWSVKSIYNTLWLTEAGITKGQDWIPEGKLFVGWASLVDKNTPIVSPENNLLLIRLGGGWKAISLSGEYAQAFEDWGKGTLTLMLELSF